MQPIPKVRDTTLRTLSGVAGGLVLIFLLGTIFALATGTREKALASVAAAPPVEGSDIFDLGQLRTKTADPKPALIALRLSLPYPAGQVAFREELGKKAPALRAAALRYLATKNAEELRPALEGGLKAGLRDVFNSLLSLGKIGELWITDLAVIQ